MEQVDASRVHPGSCAAGPWGAVAKRRADGFQAPEGDRRRTSFRLYGKEELEALLREAGLAACGTFGNLTGDPWRPDAPRLVVLAQSA